MEISHKKLKALIKDEGQASKEYDRLGLHNLARDEARHKRFLQNLDKKEYHKNPLFDYDIHNLD